MSEKLQALENLLLHPGWLLFRQHVERAWGPGACIDMIDRALQAIPSGHEAAERQTVAQIRAASRQILQLLEWPESQVKHLRDHVEQEQSEPPVSRRGPNL